ncbi:hypothetical protein [Blastococcus sp. CCUG 61487]|uniref:hypothetical protein n=1 Tax=Blastococcus sp. CCUG 61487 TaxID=1840703 RepID=UPI0010C04A32|nr:hypothetical protein [Blastococcus sp. CCUG 61487]TKJ16748.1 hypothetical protein A6V29_13145 [Blastococcus sp. CCUG 61487]
MRTRLLGLLVAGALLTAGAAACSADADADADAGSPSGAQGWRELPDPPLSPRTDAVLVGLDDALLVVGGWEFLCPPNADCAAPPTPLFADGAVYDRTDDAWRTITPAPFGLIRATTAAIDGTAYLVTGCASGPLCDAPPRLLAYDLAVDRWTDHGEVPGPATHGRNLEVVGQRLLVYSGSEGLGEVGDYWFDPENDTWTELPDDPLTDDDYDRFVVLVDDQLVLAASAVPDPDTFEAPAKRAARFDLTRQEWFVVPDAPGGGYQLLPTDRGPLLNGHYRDSAGWLLDPETWTWSELPALPEGHEDIDGVLDRDRAVYDLGHRPAGALVYDSAADAYLTVPPPSVGDGVYGWSSAILGRDLVVFGGQRWTTVRDGEVLRDAFLWTAPTG